MAILLRSLVLHGWPEDLGDTTPPAILTEIMNISNLRPKKISYRTTGTKKSRRKTVSKNSTASDALLDLPSYDDIALETPINGNFSDVACHLSFDLEYRSCLLANAPSALTIETCIVLVRAICEFVTPAYGFAYLGEGLAALLFGRGITTTTMDEATWPKARDLGWSLRTTKEHLKGKFHDVCSLNVLSDLHLERTVQDQTLRSWIEAGGRGELIKIKDNVTIWLVPDSLRRAIAAILREAGAMMTPAWIPPGSGTV